MLYNPFAIYRVSQGWHSAHNAIDYATPIGVPIGAPADGVYRRLPDELSRTNPSSAGVWGELILDDGRRIRFCHLKSHVVKSGTRVKQGQVLAYTGNSGYVLPRPTLFRPNQGAHMHTYGLTKDNKRWNWTIGASSTLPPKPAPAPATTPKPDPSWDRLTTAAVNLRASGSTKAKVILTIPAQTVVRALAKPVGKWEKVTYKGKTGWVHTDYTIDPTRTTKVAINIRKAPGTGSTRIGVVPANTPVRILATSGAWRKIKYNGVTGWIHGGYFK